MKTRIYTAKGDAGETDLLGARVGKDDVRIDLLGALDEATSAIGLGRALATHLEANELLVEVQRDLYQIMAEIAFIDEIRPDAYVLKAERVDRVTALTDHVSESVTLSPQFVLPGSTTGSAALDVARTVVRRAERQAVSAHHAGLIANPNILRYLNRLSSLLFILARAEESVAGLTAPRAKSP